MTPLQRLAIAPHQLDHQQITLTAAQQHYLRRVLRLREGDRFIAIDGTGHWLLSQLTSSQAQAIILETLDGHTELSVSIVLVIAMPKQGMDDIIRQSTELGVTTIQPVYGDRTLLKPSTQKIERWQRIAQEASEQSERQLIATVHIPCSFTELLSQEAVENLSADCNAYFICTARQNAPHLLRAISTRLSQSVMTISDNVTQTNLNRIVIAVGPEGGWTDDEIERAIACGYQPVSLGRRILRAVTAPIMALSLVTSVVEQHEI